MLWDCLASLHCQMTNKTKNTIGICSGRIIKESLTPRKINANKFEKQPNDSLLNAKNHDFRNFPLELDFTDFLFVISGVSINLTGQVF